MTTYQPDGKFIRQFVIQRKSGITTTIDQTGTFQVTNGMLAEVLTGQGVQNQKSTNAGQPYNLPRSRVIHVDDGELVLRYDPKELPEGAATNDVHLRRAAK